MKHYQRCPGTGRVPAGSVGVLCKLVLCTLALLTGLASHDPASAEIFIPEGDPGVTLEGILEGAAGIVVDRDGVVFVADSLHHVVRSYLPDGTPYRVIGREAVAGSADGSPVDARFNLPGHMATDAAGNVFLIDGTNLIRRIDAATLAVTTVANLSSGVDGTHSYDVRTGLTADNGMLGNLVPGDVAIRPNGDIFVTAADHLGVALYLVRISGAAKTAIASTAIVNPSASLWARGVAVDAQGDVLAELPGFVTPAGAQPDYIFRFPGGETSPVVNIGSPPRISRGMACGPNGWLYLASEVPADQVVMISSTNAATVMGYLGIVQTFPAVPSQSVHDVAVSPQGAVYAVNSRSLNKSGVPSTHYAKVDRFTGIDIPVGQQSGDTVLPEVTIQAPLAGQVVDTPMTLRAAASDNSGTVQVQFRIDGAIVGAPITTPPFERLLDPFQIPDGNHVITAVARDPAGNAQFSALVTFRTAAGIPNTDGEVFVSDRQLDAPVGVATDNDGDVYVADVTRILRFSPAGLLVATYGTTEAAQVDGGPAQVRFGKLKGLGRDGTGRILIVDDMTYGGPHIRRLDPATGMTETIVVLDDYAGIDVSSVYNVTTGQFEDLVASSPLCEWIPCDFGVNDAYDVTATPGGDLMVAASDGYGPDFDNYTYLIRHSASGTKALARSTVLYSVMAADRGARGVTMDGNGGVIASFPAGEIIVDHSSLIRFPGNFPATLPATVGVPVTGDGGLAVDTLNRLLVTRDAGNTLPGRVDMVPLPEATQPAGQLSRQIFDQVHDVAVDGMGNVYVTSTELRLFDSIFRTVSRVTRFASGALPPTPRVTATIPDANAVGVVLTSPVTATFSEEMNAGTMTTSTFYLSNGVTGTVSYDAPTRTATFTPQTPLVPATSYTVTLTAGISDAAGNHLAADRTWQFTTTDQVSLTVAITGDGSGSVNSTPSGIAITSGSQKASFTAGEKVKLMATASDSGSQFVGWSGDCSGTASECSLVMTADKGATATFGVMPQIRIRGNPPILFPSFSQAYLSANSGDVIEMQAGYFEGDVVLDRAVAISVMGGYDGSFATQEGFSILKGILDIQKGAATVGKLVVR